MESASVHTEIRRAWRRGAPLVLLGPGGVGKSTLGRALASILGWTLIDLDLAFCEQFEPIGAFIAAHGYDAYRAENLALAEQLIAAAPATSVFVTASGFLVASPGSADRRRADRVVAAGYAVTLLPSLDVDTATPIVVERQLKRGFGFQRETEERKFRERFAIYRSTGDMLVASLAPPEQIAAAIAATLDLTTVT
jgi:shikimate kinase